MKPATPVPLPEILNAQAAADLLSMSRAQVFEMTRARSRARMPLPIPAIRINGNLRFRRSSLLAWIADLETYEATGKVPQRIQCA